MSILIPTPADVPFKLGYRLPTVGRFAAVPRFADKAERIDPKDWEEVDFSDWRTQLYEQEHNDCAGNAMAGGEGVLWNMLTGEPKQFCAGWIYAHANGGRDEGAMIRDVVTAAMTVGCSTQDVSGEHKIFKNQYTQADLADARQHVLGEAYQCEDWVDIGSAIMRRWPVVFGVVIDRAFMESTGADGVCPARINLGAIVGGHAMFGVGLKRIGGAMRLTISQSWPQWGTPEKLGYMTEDYFRPMLRMPQYGDVVNLEAYALRTIVDRTTGGSQPPVVK